MIRSVLSSALLFAGIVSVPQTTFNLVQHNANMLAAQGRSIFELNEGYLLFSLEWSSDSTSTSLYTTLLNAEGVQLFQREFSTGRNVDPGVIDPICQQDDEYVAAVTSYGGDSPNVTFLYWFNASGDTIRTRFLKSDSASNGGNHQTRQLVALSDGGYLHCGWCSDPINTGCITRLDSTGTVLWEKVYTNTNTINNAIQLEDGGFVLGGTRNGNLDKAVVIRTDSLGVVQWTKYHGLYSLTSGERALIDNTGNVLVPGSWNPDPLWSALDRWASLYEYTPSGTLVERRDYFYNRHAAARNILDKGDGHSWMVGSMFQYEFPDAVMLLWELDENLDSLWMRRYWYYSANDAESFAYSVRSTSDGGLVMCGMTRQGITDPLPYMQSNWLLKLDEHGCLVPGCHTVGIEEVVLGLSDALTVSPNPVAQGGTLRVRFDPPDGFAAKGPLRIVVLDALGRQVHAESLSGVGQLSTSGWPSGVYYLHIADGARWIAGAKVVVE
ncbi:MAG TPA: T9SS type A sorting domain-containing protein [Flavobacteriales bacterium]|nr:T9SS type A sorting domain-containing protein [Flavobacteriales bacterium]